MLLQTKLVIPRPRATLVARCRLTDAVTRGQHCKLIVMCAPAGFGKTSLVCQWIQQEARRVAWIALDEDDSKPETFARYLIAALQSLDEELRVTLTPLMQSQTMPPPERLVKLVINHLSSLPTDCYLVLDDYHLIEPDTSPIHEAICALLHHAPPRFHLIILTRHELPFPVARLRVNHEICEISGADLCFTREETAQFFENAMPTRLSEAQVHTLHQRTEGWIACLQLAGFTCREPADVERFSGTNRPVANYLLEEVFREQSHAVQEFLLKTSILKRLHDELCNAVTEGDDAADILAYLERANLFLSPLDEERRWYRYHPLLSDFLQHRLKQTAKEWWGELHQNAAAWYAEHGLFDEARFHALTSGNLEFAANLLEEYGEAMLKQSQFVTFRQWLRQLPGEFVRTSAPLKICRVVVHLLQQDLVGMEALMTDLKQSLPRSPRPHPDAEIAWLQDYIAALEIYYFSFIHDADTVISRGTDALQTIDPDHREARSLIEVSLGVALLNRGDITEAMPPMNRALEDLDTTRPTFGAISILRSQARVEKLQGRLRQAEAILQQALTWAQDTDYLPLPVAIDLYAGLAEILYERNQLAQAFETIARHLEYAEAAMTWSWGIFSGYLIQARICQALGRSEQVRHVMRAAVDNARRTGLPIQIRSAEACAAMLAVRQGDMAAPAQWLERRQLTLAEPFSHQFELECLALAEVYLAQQRGQDAVTVLDGLRPQSLQRGRLDAVLKIDILRAAALYQLGEQSAALSALESALVLAEPEGYLHPFVAQTAWISHLLLMLQRSRDGRVRAYVPTVLRACGLEPTADSATKSVPINDEDYLTPREAEILRLLARGYPNQQIADCTFVSLNTVKTHIKHLYEKLGIKNRAQAILWAKEHLRIED